MAGKYPAYLYVITSVATGRSFVHSRGFLSKAEFRRALEEWNAFRPDLWHYAPVVPVHPMGEALDLITPTCLGMVDANEA